MLIICMQDELMAAYAREGISPTNYYWFTEQVRLSVCFIVRICVSDVVSVCVSVA